MCSVLVPIKARDITHGRIEEGEQAHSVHRGPRFPALLANGERGFLFALCTLKPEPRKERMDMVSETRRDI